MDLVQKSACGADGGLRISLRRLRTRSRHEEVECTREKEQQRRKRVFVFGSAMRFHCSLFEIRVAIVAALANGDDQERRNEQVQYMSQQTAKRTLIRSS